MDINLTPTTDSEVQSLIPDFSKLTLPEPKQVLLPQVAITREDKWKFPENLQPVKESNPECPRVFEFPLTGDWTSGYASPTDMTGEHWVPSEDLRVDFQELLDGFQDVPSAEEMLEQVAAAKEAASIQLTAVIPYPPEEYPFNMNFDVVNGWWYLEDTRFAGGRKYPIFARNGKNTVVVEWVCSIKLVMLVQCRRWEEAYRASDYWDWHSWQITYEINQKYFKP